MSARPIAVPRPEVEKRADPTIGPYRILHLIGEGTIGRVYLAEHEKLGRKVAVKVLKKRFADNLAVVRRFFGEARAMNRIHHEHVVEVTDFIETTDGKSCYVMELLAGRSLADLIADREPIAMESILSIGRQLASALSAVHAQSVVHRDVKPDNVFLTSRSGQLDFVKLLDFGVARLTSFDDDSLRHRTLLGALIGTPEYMSPEQTLGVEVDPSSDVYSLGVVLYELVAGHRPFEGATVKEVLEAQRGQRPPRLDRPPVRAPRALAELVDRCLAKDPSARPSMADIGETLADLAEAHAPSRRPLFFGAATLAFGVLVLAAAAWKRIAYEAEPPIVIVPPVPIELAIETSDAKQPGGRASPHEPLIETIEAPIAPRPPRVEVPGRITEAPPAATAPERRRAARPAPKRPKVERRTGPIDRDEIRDPFAEGS